MQYWAGIFVYKAAFMSELEWNLEIFLESILFSFDYSFNDFFLSTSHCHL